jgi:hypothetical protein
MRFAVRLASLAAIAALLAPAFARAGSQEEYECQESFEKLLRFEVGWKARLKATGDPVTCRQLAAGATRLAPAPPPSCGEIPTAEVSREFKETIRRALAGGRRHRVPKKTILKVYQQVYNRVTGWFRWRCRAVEGLADPSAWEPGVPVERLLGKPQPKTGQQPEARSSPRVERGSQNP